MSKRSRVILSAAVVLMAGSGLLLANNALTQNTKKPAKPAAESSEAGVLKVGKRETAKWTKTTYESATSEAHKAVLKGGKVATVVGEVVEVSCYMQLGKRGKAHVECATSCIENGQPVGIVDAEGNLYILFAEEHHPRRDGDISFAEAFIPLLSRQVSATGMMTEMRGYRALFLQGEEAETMIEKMKLD